MLDLKKHSFSFISADRATSFLNIKHACLEFPSISTLPILTGLSESSSK